MVKEYKKFTDISKLPEWSCIAVHPRGLISDDLDYYILHKRTSKEDGVVEFELMDDNTFTDDINEIINDGIIIAWTEFQIMKSNTYFMETLLKDIKEHVNRMKDQYQIEDDEEFEFELKDDDINMIYRNKNFPTLAIEIDEVYKSYKDIYISIRDMVADIVKYSRETLADNVKDN